MAMRLRLLAPLGIMLAILAGAIVAPANLRAQADPQVLFGSAAALTIDGVPLTAGDPVEAVTLQGPVVAVAEWADDYWFLTLPVGSGVVQVRSGTARSASLTVRAGTVREVAAMAMFETGSTEDAAISLGSGWNLVGWLGATTAIEEAVGGIAGLLQGVYAWDEAEGRFLRYHPAGPAFLNTLERVDPAQGLWVLMTAAATWTQPALPGVSAARNVELAPGFNLALWTGADDTAAADVFGAEPGLIGAVFAFDPAGQRFDSYTPGGAAILNRLEALRFGHGLWLRATDAAIFELPAGP